MKCFIFTVLLFVGLCQGEIPSGIPDFDDFEGIKERCDQKSGPETYNKVKAAIEETQKCIKGIIDVEKIKSEVEEAKKTGSMDEVFGKYCGKRPQIKECIKKTYDAVQPCLETAEKEAINVTGEIITRMAEFACYKDGDRIAMFVAEGGVECLNSRAESIKNCVNQTVKFNPATFSPNSIPNLKIDKKKCDDFSTIQSCIVDDLEEHCSDSTPSNIVDALFRFVKKMVCKDVKPKRSISLNRVIRSAMTTTHAKAIEQLENKLKATCLKYGEEGAYEKVMASYNESKNCLIKYRIFVTPYSVYRENLDSCTTDLRNTMKQCLNEEGKYYPDFILELLQSLFGFIYANANALLQSSRSSPNAELASCMRAINHQDAQLKIFKCLNDTYTADESNTNDVVAIPPKSQLCKRLKLADTCVSTFIINTCIRDIKITKLVNDVIAAVEAPCQNTTISETEN